MAFIITKRNKRTGKTYHYWQRSVRVGGRVVSEHLGKLEPSVPALLWDEKTAEQEKAAQSRAAELNNLTVSGQEPLGRENELTSFDGDEAANAGVGVAEGQKD